MPEIKKRDIAREPIKVVDQTAAASQHMKEALVKAKEKARENTPAKEETPEEYASDKITGSTETVFYSGMHLAQEVARSRRKASAKKADRAEDTKAAQPREPPRDQATEAGRRAAAKSAKKSAEEKRAAESSVGVAESEASVLPEPLAHSDPAAPSPPDEAASHQPEKAEAKSRIPGHRKKQKCNHLKALCPMKRKYCFQIPAQVKEPGISKTQPGHRTKSLSRAIMRYRRAQDPQSKRHKRLPMLRTRLQRTRRRLQAAPQLPQRKLHGPQLPRRKLSLLPS